MTEFTDQYKNMIIKQYWDKPKAVAEIELKSAIVERVFSLLNSFISELDVDLATGDRLDKIGLIVGLDRTNIIPFFAEYFGFDDNPGSLSFGSVSTPLLGGPFYSVSYPDSVQTAFTDDDYRFYLKAKISVNNSSSYVMSDDRVTIQDVIQYLFDGLAYVIDNLNMSMTLMVDTSVNAVLVKIANSIGLLTRPQGVRYNALISGNDDFFGFDGDDDALGFGDLSSETYGGEWSNLIV